MEVAGQEGNNLSRWHSSTLCPIRARISAFTFILYYISLSLGIFQPICPGTPRPRIALGAGLPPTEPTTFQKSLYCVHRPGEAPGWQMRSGPTLDRICNSQEQRLIIHSDRQAFQVRNSTTQCRPLPNSSVSPYLTLPRVYQPFTRSASVFPHKHSSKCSISATSFPTKDSPSRNQTMKCAG